MPRAPTPARAHSEGRPRQEVYARLGFGQRFEQAGRVWFALFELPVWCRTDDQEALGLEADQPPGWFDDSCTVRAHPWLSDGE
jgi:hypothetical protein